MFANLRAEMARNRKTNKEMADFLSLSDNGFSFKLNGKNQFTLAEMAQMADLFGCSIDYLAGRKEDRTMATPAASLTNDHAISAAAY